MMNSETIINGFSALTEGVPLVNIHGEAGSGKSTLACFLVGHLLTRSTPYESCCVWLQASKKFSKKRLFEIFEGNPNQLDYLKHNFFVKPSTRIMTSYAEQSDIIKDLVRLDKILPPSLKYLVIDNISNKLRLEISKKLDFKNRNSLVNDFFNSQLLPLVAFSVRTGVSVILIHEVSYDPNIDKNAPFFHKLYDRISSLSVELANSFGSKDKKMIISYKGKNKQLNYHIKSNGFDFF